MSDSNDSREDIRIVRAKRERLQLEMEELQAEELRERIMQARQRRANLIRAHKIQQEAIEEEQRKRAFEQSVCKHRKGGKNLEGILKGQDANYSVVVNQYPWGDVAVLCTRCGKEWWPPLSGWQKQHRPAEYKAATDSLRSDSAEYRRQLAIYHEAMAMPTDNEESGSQLFSFTRGGAPVSTAELAAVPQGVAAYEEAATT